MNKIFLDIYETAVIDITALWYVGVIGYAASYIPLLPEPYVTYFSTNVCFSKDRSYKD